MRTFDFSSFTKKPYRLAVMLIIILVFFTTSVGAESTKSAKPSLSDIIHQAVAEGKIAYKLTTAEKLKALLGKPQRENEKDEGHVIWLDMGYPDIDAWFMKRDGDTSFKLLSLSIADKGLDIGGMLQGQRQVIVRNIDDFHEIDLRNVNLKNLDLSGEWDYLKGEDFDSLTQWPGPGKLPAGFDPQKLLEDGKNPGLGIRSFHEQGINGKGIGIAILDQPLLLGHEEYTSRLLRYDATRSIGMWPQMHGSPIVGIAVGKTCGVAPSAFVFYYAAPTTMKHRIQADYINEIVKYNETNPDTGQIRVISISASPERASDNDAFLKAHKKALDAGILVVTCSRKFLYYGNLTLIEGEDPDNPESYKLGRFGDSTDLLLIPTGNKTIATHQGINVYKYERGGGMSWAAPYIAGLAALAFQVNPNLQPETIVEQLVKTATHTKAGPVVNPRGFIESIRPESTKSVKPSLADIIHQAVAEGKLAYRLTTPDEFKAIAGQPTKEWTEYDGELICMEYPGIKARFFGKPEINVSHTIVGVLCEGKEIDIGEDRPIALRYEEELDKFESVMGYSGVDLSRLDLSRKGELLKAMPFDSFTIWPKSHLLPPDFDPKAVMEWGKYPGLRVKQLHDRGVTGKGVHVAIIDQPLLLDHIEYRDQLASYTDIQTGNSGPAMHGTAVASLLVGKTCGTAPEALLHFWAEPSWKGDYKYRCIALEQIIQYNRGKEKSEQIRILSVSKGFSRDEPNLDRWKTLLEKAKQSGIYVVHCESMGFGAGCQFLKDSDNPANYRLCAFYDGGPVYERSGTFFSPIDNRTIASQEAKDAYTFWTRGGLSWGAPYIAGVLALGMQVNPDLSVEQIDKLLYESGWDFQRGKLINPMGFVEAARDAVD